MITFQSRVKAKFYLCSVKKHPAVNSIKQVSAIGTKGAVVQQKKVNASARWPAAAKGATPVWVRHQDHMTKHQLTWDENREQLDNKIFTVCTV